jgi:hypothetical protein
MRGVIEHMQAGRVLQVLMLPRSQSAYLSNVDRIPSITTVLALRRRRLITESEPRKRRQMGSKWAVMRLTRRGWAWKP